MFEIYETIYLAPQTDRAAPGVRHPTPDFSTSILRLLYRSLVCLLLLLCTVLPRNAWAAGIDIAFPNISGVFGGSSTMISGTGFTGVTDVAFGSVTLNRTDWKFVNDTRITATVPASAGGFVGNVDVIVWKGATKLTMRNGFVYTRLNPTITSILPRQVGLMGGQTVTIKGSDLTLMQAVSFNGVAANPATFVQVDSRTLQVKVPVSAGNATGPVNVSIQTSYGTASTTSFLSYYQQNPSITSVSPPSGGINGGTTVSINGANLADTLEVKFGAVSVDPSSIVQNGPNAISVKAPASGSQSPSTVDVSVTTSTGSVTVPGAFSYTVSNPTILSISPATSPAFGGITATITGSGLTDTIAVNVGNSWADPSTIRVIDDSQVSFKVPPSLSLNPGVNFVRIVTQTGQATLLSAYTYTRQDPIITAVTPNHGPVFGGYPITITGVGLTDVTEVKVGWTTLTRASFTVNADGSLTVNLPMANVGVVPGSNPVAYFPNTYAGSVDITVTTPAGSKTQANAFTYDVRNDPVITNVSPTTGIDTGKTYVVVDGSNFNNLQGVRFAGTWADIVSATPTQIRLKTPSRSAGRVGMTVQTATGYVTKPVFFDFVASPPSPTTYQFLGSPTPTVASTNGTTKISINGDNLSDATVTFGGIPAIVLNATKSNITCFAPVNTAGVKTIVVTTLGGSYSPSVMPTITYQLQPPATVTGASLNTGTVVGGTEVTINGTNLQGATVTFDGITAPIVSNPMDGLSVTVTTPPRATAGNVPVVVNTPAGVPATVAGGFTYMIPPAPVISNVTPTTVSGTGGNVVSLTGSDLSGATVTVDGLAVSNLQFVTDSILTFVAAPHVPGTVPIRVTTPGGSATNSLTYATPPYFLTGVSPSSDSILGGATVTMTGENLAGVTVFFDAVPATNVVIAADGKSLTAKVPAHVAGPSTIWIYNASAGSVGFPNAFTFTTPPPTLATVSPVTGNTFVGTSVMIMGTNLWDARVLFGTTPATGVAVAANGLSLTAYAPARPLGTVDVSVTTPGGTATKTAAFNYIIQPPDLFSMDIASGTVDGGTTVVISGRFLQGATVAFDGVPATNVVVNSTGYTATAQSPAHVPGVVQITATTAGGTSTLQQPFLYDAPSPLVTSISPATGLTRGGSTITFNGKYLWDAQVHFGSVQATSVTVAPDGLSLTAVLPARREGQVDVTVSVPGKTDVVLANGFTYTAPLPVVTAINPARGPLTGNTPITLTGTDLTPTSVVNFGTQVITPSVVSLDGLSLTFDLPPSATLATVPVSVTTSGGTSVPLNFAYAPVPTLTGASASMGPFGGSSVTVNGTDFIPGATVNFNGQTITPDTIDSSGHSLTFTTPAVSAPATVSYTVTTAGGTTASADFEYVPQPVIGTLSPAVGTLSSVSISVSGSGFLPGTQVNFNGQVITPDTIDSTGTALTFTAPAVTAGVTAATTVTNAGGTSNSVDYIYMGQPRLNTLGVTMGPETAGQVLTITGTDLAGVTSVKFGATPATITGTTATTVDMVVPAGTGTVSVVATSPGGISNGLDYTYVPLPVISGSTPSRGPFAGGSVTVNGSNFTAGTKVDFNGQVITPVTIDSAGTSLTFTAPSAAAAGTVSFTVTAAGGTSNAATYTYVVAPVLTSLDVTSGPETAGQAVKITGTNLAGVTGVRFGTASATIINATATMVEVTAPAGTGSVSVTVTTDGGPSNGLAYRFVPLPTLTGINPAIGPLGGTMQVTLTGTNFTADSTVRFGSRILTPDSVASNGLSLTMTTLSATVAGSVPVAVMATGGTTAASITYRYADAPVITGLSVASGPLSGGTALDIIGRHFSGSVAVTIGGTPVTGISVSGAEDRIHLITPAGTAGNAVVAVAAAGGTTTSPADFNYLRVPTIGSLSVSRGPETAGQTVTITGTDLAAVTAVKFGTASATITNATATTVSVTAPAGHGTVGVTLATPGGTSNAVNYTYVPVPVISSFSPSMGPLSGMSVQVNGSDFVAGSKITFDGQDIPLDQLDGSGTWLTFTAPAVPSARTASFTVTTLGGTSAAESYVYVDRPVISSATPEGPLAGGTVSVSGSGFLPGTTVNFNGQVITPSLGSGGNALTFAAPSATTAGAVSFTVTAPGGTSNAVTYTYVAAPALTSLSVTSGSEAAGQAVTITGTDLAGATSVKFGTAAATITRVTATAVDVTAPAGRGTVGVTVTTIGGASNALSYTYVPVPVISGLDSLSGPLAGGSITVYGSNFVAGTRVTFDGQDIVPATIDSAGTSLTFTAPPVTAAATVSLTVKTIGGTSNPVNYSYVSGPGIARITPSAAPLGGGIVTVSGSGFFPGTVVTLDGRSITPTSINGSGTSLTFTAPPVPAPTVVSLTVSNSGGTSNAVDYTYAGQPHIGSLSVASGPETAGQRITITGTDLATVTSVTFGPVSGTVISATATTVDVTVPAGHGTVGVTVASVGGTSNALNYTYVPVPVISSFSPSMGPFSGGSVRVNGSDFVAGTRVTFDGQDIPPDTLDSAGTWLTFTVPSVTTVRSVSFTIETTGGTSNAERYAYMDKPAISSATPAEGPLGGGVVSVSGSGFLPGTTVDFNGRTITPSLASGGNALTFTAPSVTTPGTVSYTVTAAGGTSNAATYVYVDAPSISSLTQTMGPETGGQALHITGTNMARITDVKFGTIAATFSNAAANGVDVTVPAGTGTVGVTVSHVGGTSNAIDYTYVPLPIISRLSSFSGPLVGGSITVHGANFGSGTGVVFDGQLKTPTTIDPAGTWLKFNADPVAAPHSVWLTVTTPGGASNAVTYSYVNGPGISLITPSAGPLGGGSVTITGSGFLSDTTVNFNGQVITPASINAAGTSLTFAVPAVTAAATVPLTISNTGGTSNAVDYTYVDQPHISSLSATSGPETSGQTVTIIGTDLATVTGVRFGTLSATINSVTSSTVTVTVPAGHGTVGVTVESVGGTSNAVSYTYVPVPVISSFGPSMGPLSGGSVRVNGADFVVGTKVTFDGQDIPLDQLDSSGTWLTFTAPSVPSAKTVSLTVTTVGGTSGAEDYEYVDKPVITSMTPASASLAGGSVTMSGSGFLPDTTVTFGGQVITPDSIGSGGNALTFTAPSAAAAASVPVSVINIGGMSNGVTFTYVGQPHITSLSVTSGPETAGQSVTITGTDLAGVTSVNFGTTAATINSVTATTVDVTAPAGTGSVSVTVASTGGTSNGVSYTYVPVPTLTALSPAIGPSGGNTQVTLNGSNFTAGSIVHFGNLDVAGGTVGSGGASLTVTSPPAMAAGTVPVHVTTEGGSTSSVSFRYIDVPVITGLSVQAGPLTGGTVLEIFGSNFSGVVSVTIGGTSVSGISVAGNESSIRLTTPPGTAGNAAVTVTAAGGTATSPDDFVYLNAPAVSTLSRAAGPEAGGQSVRINGSDLGAVTRVLFGTAQATIDAVSSSSVDVTTPAGSGSVAVTVESAGGSDSSATYLYVPVPVISSLDKTSGASSGGQPLRISGTGLTNVLYVDFSGRIASITSNTATTVDVVLPPGSGTVDVRVTTHGGTSQPLSFTYLNAPRIANLDLTMGPEAGGQRVHLAGSDLGGITGVQFGTNAATIVPGSASPTGVDVIAPAGTGTVSVTATTPGGTSSGVNYTYAPVPSVASIDVTSGPLGGGTRVTVTGSGFVTGAKVLLGSQSLTPASIAAGGTSLTFTTPLAGAPGPVTIAVETVGGVSASTATFTYLDGPILSQVNPSAGSSLGGQTVRLTGAGLQVVTQVSFGASSAAMVPGSATSTTLDVVTPPGQGPVAVTATSPGGTSNSVVYTYVDGPQISTVSPKAGPVAGGFEVTIGGSSLGSPQSVTVDGSPVTPSAIATDGSWIKVMMPQHAAGGVAITVQTVGGGGKPHERFRVCGHTRDFRNEPRGRAGCWRKCQRSQRAELHAGH